MEAFDFSQLNDAQREIVQTLDGAVLVTAGAGSGKTRVLTYRIANLVLCHQVSPYNILAITFTNKATEEMHQRLHQMIPYSQGMWISTFHSMCVRILKKYIERLGYAPNFSIYTDVERERVLKKLTKNSAKKDDERSKDIVKALMSMISDAKNMGMSPDEYLNLAPSARRRELCRYYQLYEEELRRSNALDFDDLLLRTLELLRTNQDVLEYYSDRFRYIHVDEFQDTNTVQYELVKLLASTHGNVFVVGDEDQSIYGWRGARVSNIFDFQRDFPAKVYKLEQNYRSTAQILQLANRVIACNTNRIKKVLWTDNGDGSPIDCRALRNESAEADFVIETINQLVRYSSYRYSDIAILMRINALSRPFEERMLAYRIPHKIFGGFKFFERKEVKDLVAYLKLLNNPHDEEALLRIINFPRRGIGDGTVSHLLNFSSFNMIGLYRVIRSIASNHDLPKAVIAKVAPLAQLLERLEQLTELPVDQLVVSLIQILDLRKEYGADTEENLNRRHNIAEFVNLVTSRVADQPQLTLGEFLDSIMLYSDLDEYDQKNECVTIATVHSAKGLEFPVVFVVGLEEGLFPVSRAVDNPDDMEEERRLMYVATTRARQRLYLTYCQTRFVYGKRRTMLPSNFLVDGQVLATHRPPSAVSAPPPRRQPATFSPVPTPASPTSADTSRFAVGQKVTHPRFGVGTILSLTGSGSSLYAEVSFDSIGKIKLAMAFAPLTITGGN